MIHGLAFNALIMAVALLAEAAFGYPDRLHRAIGHPVVWIGAAIAWLDRIFNRAPNSRRRGAGVAALAMLLIGAGGAGWLIQRGLAWALPHWACVAVVGVLASMLLAQRSLWRHVADVADGLRIDLSSGRAAVSHIVGRDPGSLDEAGVARAAIESLAENFSDGVVAPVLWGVALGLPGILLYKAINTADSMIGHRTPRHEAFGWASARLDDFVNLPASRLSAGLLVAAASLAGSDAGQGVRAVRRDASHHRSPNAGWPEAAMAGALGLRLAGPRVYGSVRVADGWMGDGRASADAADIVAALRLYRLACALGVCLVLAAAVVLG